jgi:hypothetical protein
MSIHSGTVLHSAVMAQPRAFSTAQTVGQHSFKTIPDEGATYRRFTTDTIPMPSKLVAEIEKLIAERLQYRNAFDFDAADAIQVLLRRKYGVLIDDMNQLWQVMFVPMPNVDVAEVQQTKGGPRKKESSQLVTSSNRDHVAKILASMAGEAPSAKQTAQTSSNERYTRDPDDIVYMGRAKVKEVEHVVYKRGVLLKDRTVNADAIRELEETLLDTFNVRCDDKTRTWAVVDYRHNDFEEVDVRSSRQQPPKRSAKQTSSRRGEETGAMDWRDSQATQDVPRPRAKAATPVSDNTGDVGAYTRDPGDITYLGRAEVAAVKQLVQQRADLLDGGSAAPDEVLELEYRLQGEFSVHCDDATRTWSVVHQVEPKATSKKGKSSQSVEKAPPKASPKAASKASSKTEAPPPPAPRAEKRERAPAPGDEPYARAADDITYLGRADVATVTKLVQQRAALLNDPSSKDEDIFEVVDLLRGEYSVRCDDASRTWSVVHDFSQPAATASKKAKSKSTKKIASQRVDTEWDAFFESEPPPPVKKAEPRSEERVSVKSVPKPAAKPVAVAVDEDAYKRAADDITYLGRSEVATVNELVQLRRKMLADPAAKDDDILDLEDRLLAEFSVRCDDDTRTWAVVHDFSTAASKSASKSKGNGSAKQSASKKGGGARYYSTTRSTLSDAQAVGDESTQPPADGEHVVFAKKAALGPEDYRRDENDITYVDRAEIAAITELVQRRNALRKDPSASVVDLADIQTKLRVQYQVYVSDATRTWTKSRNRKDSLTPEKLKEIKQRKEQWAASGRHRSGR